MYVGKITKIIRSGGAHAVGGTAGTFYPARMIMIGAEGITFRVVQYLDALVGSFGERLEGERSGHDAAGIKAFLSETCDIFDGLLPSERLNIFFDNLVCASGVCGRWCGAGHMFGCFQQRGGNRNARAVLTG